MVLLLRSHGVEVLVLEDTPLPEKPDAVFPNNWFSCCNGTIHIFPMFAKNRQPEKRLELIEIIKNKTGINKITDWSHYEKDHVFLEGTGSMIIDHENKIIYACTSKRTDKGLFKKFCKEYKYSPLIFKAADKTGNEIYHTNVMMCIGTGFAVVCLDAVANRVEKKIIIHELETSGHELATISFEQLQNFAGNMLQLINKKGEQLLVMSTTAFASLHQEQITILQKYSTIITPNVSHIEKAAGGSVRCMMAELFY